MSDKNSAEILSVAETPLNVWSASELDLRPNFVSRDFVYKVYLALIRVGETRTDTAIR